VCNWDEMEENKNRGMKENGMGEDFSSESTIFAPS
jgi:hypothetical protein